MSNYIDVQRIMINIDKYLRYITLFNSFKNYHKVNLRYIAMTVIIENYHKVNWRAIISDNVNYRYLVYLKNISINKIFIFAIIS